VKTAKIMVLLLDLLLIKTANVLVNKDFLESFVKKHKNAQLVQIIRPVKMEVFQKVKGQKATVVAYAFQITKVQTVKHQFLALQAPRMAYFALMEFSKETW